MLICWCSMMLANPLEDPKPWHWSSFVGLPALPGSNYPPRTPALWPPFPSSLFLSFCPTVHCPLGDQLLELTALRHRWGHLSLPGPSACLQQLLAGGQFRGRSRGRETEGERSGLWQAKLSTGQQLSSACPGKSDGEFSAKSKLWLPLGIIRIPIPSCVYVSGAARCIEACSHMWANFKNLLSNSGITLT